MSEERETPKNAAITCGQFSQQAAYIAKNAAAWAGDVLVLPERYGEPIRMDSVERFVADIRQHCDIIERWAKEGAWS